MRRELSIFVLLVASWLAIAANGQPVGLDSTRDEVLAQFGEPDGTVKFGDDEVLSYRSIEVQLHDKHVTKLLRLNNQPLPVNKPSTSKKSAPAKSSSASASRGARQTPSVATNETVAATPPSAPENKKSWTPAMINGVFLIGTGALVALAAGIWLVVRAFKVGLAWGLACLFLPLAPIVFACMHWGEGRKPFLISLGGTAVAVAGIFVTRM